MDVGTEIRAQAPVCGPVRAANDSLWAGRWPESKIGPRNQPVKHAGFLQEAEMFVASDRLLCPQQIRVEKRLKTLIGQ